MPTAAVTATAPVRVADAGGWTDTWFAGTGLVCSVAAGPAVTVTASCVDGPAGWVDLEATTYGDRYGFAVGARPGRHPLLEAAVARWARRDVALCVRVSSAVPPGSGLGTSASVAVALVGALRALAGRTGEPDAIARAAHDLETVDLGLQSGVQDQAAAAHGGALRLVIDPYPSIRVERIAVPGAVWTALADRLVTVSLGRPHTSSAVHETVIAALRARASGGPDPLDVLRQAASSAAAALAAGDLERYGAALTAATEGQRAMHPALVSADADAVWAVARGAGAVGWKVNGAGGSGGSVTVLAGPGGGARLRRALAASGWPPLALRPTTAGLVIRPGTPRAANRPRFAAPSP